MKEEAEKWWRKSENDLETAKILAENDKLSEVAFFLQQPIEKALKALIIEKSDEFPKIHDLVSLGRGVELPGELLDYCKGISPAYTTLAIPTSPRVRN